MARIRSVKPELHPSARVGSDGWPDFVPSDIEQVYIPETRQVRWLATDFPGYPPRWVLYRMWADSGELLYVGISWSLPERWRTHRREVAWWHDVSWIGCQSFPGPHLALAAERMAIRREWPVFNIRCALPGRADAF